MYLPCLFEKGVGTNWDPSPHDSRNLGSTSGLDRSRALSLFCPGTSTQLSLPLSSGRFQWAVFCWATALEPQLDSVSAFGAAPVWGAVLGSCGVEIPANVEADRETGREEQVPDPRLIRVIIEHLFEMWVPGPLSLIQ